MGCEPDGVQPSEYEGLVGVAAQGIVFGGERQAERFAAASHTKGKTRAGQIKIFQVGMPPGLDLGEHVISAVDGQIRPLLSAEMEFAQCGPVDLIDIRRSEAAAAALCGRSQCLDPQIALLNSFREIWVLSDDGKNEANTVRRL